MFNLKFISAWHRIYIIKWIYLCYLSDIVEVPLQTYLKAAQASQGSRTLVCALRSASSPSVNSSKEL
jgi:hypothetical protein